MSILILGGYQSDFARNAAREGRGLPELVEEGITGALTDAKVDASQVGSLHVANAFGELFCGQAHLGAMPATVNEALVGIPASRHEAACASGGVALLAAMADLESGRYDCCLVLGVEQERNVPGDVAVKHLGAAAWVGREGQTARAMWPHLFSRVADEYDRRWGLKHAHLAHLAKKNFDNARRNPLAQTRGWSFSEASFREDDAANPLVEGRLRRQDCSQLTDGVSAVMLCTDDFARARGRDLASLPRILGWGHRSAGLPLEPKLERSRETPYALPHLRQAILDAYRRARLDGPWALSGIETHDCFSITEYLAIDHFGLTPPGMSFRAIEEGVVDFGGKLPVNPSGGLMGGGHPVGATGVRMVWDAARQVTGRAGACQVEGAHTFGTLNLGGSAGTVVTFVVGRA